MAIFPFISALLVFGVGAAEDRLVDPKRTESITSAVTFRATPEQMWNMIVALDEVSSKKPLLLRIGLPIPKSCTLEGSGVGAKRICHFDSGVLEERITAWDPPRYLEMKIVMSTLPGRHWLGFESASYRIEDAGHGEVRLTRTTTISSQLRPADYWRPLETWGVESEHRYLFESLRTKVYP